MKAAAVQRPMSRVIYRYKSLLLPAQFIRRTNRFVCKVQMDTRDAPPRAGSAAAGSGDLTDVYCPNTGSMLNLLPTPGLPRNCHLSSVPKSNSSAALLGEGKSKAKAAPRKYAHTLEVVQDHDSGAWVGIQSRLANDMVHSALQQGLIPELQGYSQLRREVTTTHGGYGRGGGSSTGVCASADAGAGARSGNEDEETSRTDFQLMWHAAAAATPTPTTATAASSSSSNDPFAAFACPSHVGTVSHSSTTVETASESVTCNMLMEVKSVTLVRDKSDGNTGTSAGNNRIAEFPDCVSARASKHLRCLMEHKAANPKLHRAAVFFLIQRDDCNSFQACHIDAEYTALLETAVAAGVEVIAYACRLDPSRGVVTLLQDAVLHKPNPLPPDVMLELQRKKAKSKRKRKRKVVTPDSRCEEEKV